MPPRKESLFPATPQRKRRHSPRLQQGARCSIQWHGRTERHHLAPRLIHRRRQKLRALQRLARPRSGRRNAGRIASLPRVEPTPTSRDPTRFVATPCALTRFQIDREEERDERWRSDSRDHHLPHLRRSPLHAPTTAWLARAHGFPDPRAATRFGSCKTCDSGSHRLSARTHFGFAGPRRAWCGRDRDYDLRLRYIVPPSGIFFRQSRSECLLFLPWVIEVRHSLFRRRP